MKSDAAAELIQRHCKSSSSTARPAAKRLVPDACGAFSSGTRADHDEARQKADLGRDEDQIPRRFEIPALIECPHHDLRDKNERSGARPSLRYAVLTLSPSGLIMSQAWAINGPLS